MKEYAVLRDFVQSKAKGPPKELEPTLRRLAKALGESGEEGLVQVRIVGEQEPRRFQFKLTSKGCALEMKEAGKPTLELIGREEAVWSILNGSLSPLEAFRRGVLRVRGDVKLGRRLLRQIASSPNAKFDVCETGV